MCNRFNAIRVRKRLVIKVATDYGISDIALKKGVVTLTAVIDVRVQRNCAIMSR